MERSVRDCFDYCPSCGERRAAGERANPFHCPQCGLLLYLNPGAAVAGIVVDRPGRILLLRRQKEPGKGKFGLPGGFVEAGESAEAALRREVREETRLEIETYRFMASFPNDYAYKGVVYPVIDSFFVCQVDSFERLRPDDREVASLHPCHPARIDLGQMAFRSNRRALERYLKDATGGLQTEDRG